MQNIFVGSESIALGEHSGWLWIFFLMSRHVFVYGAGKKKGGVWLKYYCCLHFLSELYSPRGQNILQILQS